VAGTPPLTTAIPWPTVAIARCVSLGEPALLGGRLRLLETAVRGGLPFNNGPLGEESSPRTASDARSFQP
jgi:hypothetical protein